jgi:hypothetical protein
MSSTRSAAAARTCHAAPEHASKEPQSEPNEVQGEGHALLAEDSTDRPQTIDDSTRRHRRSVAMPVLGVYTAPGGLNGFGSAALLRDVEGHAIDRRRSDQAKGLRLNR